MKDLRVGRRDGESSGDAALGFVDDDDYDGALLIDGGVTHNKKWAINAGCSFHICCEKEKFAKLSYVDEGLFTLPNDERVKVEGISEVVIMTRNGVKRRLGGVRYVPKLERNLISLGRLESKVCTFKASDGFLKVIKESMVLMRGRRSESNLYVLQVDGGCLGHMDDCKSPKKVTFDDDERFELEGEIVVSSSKSHLDGGEFDHLVAYSLSYTFENEVMSAKKYESIYFGSLNEMINEDDLECLNERKARRLEGFEDHSTSRARVAPSSQVSTTSSALLVELGLLDRATSSVQNRMFLFYAGFLVGF